MLFLRSGSPASLEVLFLSSLLASAYHHLVVYIVGHSDTTDTNVTTDASVTSATSATSATNFIGNTLVTGGSDAVLGRR